MSGELRARVARPLLLLIVAAGFALRVWNINFDQGIGSHPDERSTACFYAAALRLPASWAEFRDPQQSPLNPLWDRERQERRSFTYGHFPLYLGVAMGEAWHALAPAAERLGAPQAATALMARANQACNAVAGRFTIALLDTLTIFLLYLLGARLYGRGGGLLAAAFYAFAAQAIQLSHFFAMDPASTTFTVLAVLGSVQMVLGGERLDVQRLARSLYADALLAGLGAGLAIASKFSALPILAAPVVAGLLVLAGEGRAAAQAGRPADGRTQVRALLGILLALAAAALAFAVASPYAILDARSFLQATLVEQGRMVRGVADPPFTRQYRNTTPYLYFIRQQVQWGLGWALGGVALAGTLWALVRLFRSLIRMVRRGPGVERFAESLNGRWPGRAELGEIVVWSWVIPYFGITGLFLAKFNRYMSPVLPFALLFGAGLIVALWNVGRSVASPRAGPGRSNASPYARAAAVALAVMGVAGGLFWSLAYVNGVYGREHTWIAASRWIYANAPHGATVLWEQWDDPLPVQIPGAPGVLIGGPGQCEGADSPFRLCRTDWGPYEEDTAEKYELLKQKLREADFVAYSSKRIYDSVDELPARYPMTNLYYDAMWDGRLGFELAHEATAPPQLFGWAFDDRRADESWSLYDHPQATIFRKVRDLSDAEFDALFGRIWETAIPYDRGPGSPLEPLLGLVGLGQTEASAERGLINRVTALLTGEDAAPEPPPSPGALMLETPLAELPVVDNYRWNVTASESPWLAALWWWAVVALLGWLAWPLSFALFRSLRDRGYLLSRALGWLLPGWLLWFLASVGLLSNTVLNAWLVVGLLALAGLLAALSNLQSLFSYLRTHWKLLLAGELLFAAAYAAFIGVRLLNPDLWQPWLGGEKYMEFAFLTGILRSPEFPPVNPHFAGGVINYYYFGLYLVAFLIKLTGIYAEVAFNLAIPTLFALTVVNTFAVAYSAYAAWDKGVFPFFGAPRRSRRAAAGRVSPPADPVETLHATSMRVDDGDPVETLHATSARVDDGDPQPEAAAAADAAAGRVSPPTDPVETLHATSMRVDDGDPQPEAAATAAALATRSVASSVPTQSVGASTNGPQSPITNHQSPITPLPWRAGFAAALLAPLFVVLIGNLDGFAQLLRNFAGLSPSAFQSALPGVQTLVRAADGARLVLAEGASVPAYDFWGPSRVLPATINEFPYWSFLFADLHPHLIGIPFAALFLAVVLALLIEARVEWGRARLHGLALVATLALLLGTLASVNLWELPTYLALGVFAFVLSQWLGHGRVRPLPTLAVAALYGGLAFLAYAPFFLGYTNVGASGVGLVQAGDPPGLWLLIWGFLGFVVVSWVLWAAARPAVPTPDGVRPTAVERAPALGFRRFDRLPRAIYLHGRLVQRPGAGYMLALAAIPLTLLPAVAAAVWGRWVLALCLLPLGPAFLLLWRRGRAADPGSQFAALLALTGLAILAGTQVVYLKDFLSGSEYYRMNTLFKFFSQVWVIWGIAAAVALPRLWGGWVAAGAGRARVARAGRWAWGAAFALLLAASLAYPLLGTPARVEQRFVGWRPPLGTLNALDYMREGVYTWPDDSNPIALRYDWEAIQWLLEHVRGNAVIVESSERDYYRAGGTRVASTTGLGGLLGMHEQEQRYGEQTGQRDGLQREFWASNDPARMAAIADELAVDLVYVGQLERYLHPGAAALLEQMAAAGTLETLYENERTVIYAVPGRMAGRLQP